MINALCQNSLGVIPVKCLYLCCMYMGSMGDIQFKGDLSKQIPWEL